METPPVVTEPAAEPATTVASEPRSKARRRARERPGPQEIPAEPAPPARPQKRISGGRRSEDRGDWLARSLQTYRGTQVPADLALRARDFARPTAADLAAAEADLVIVRRNYVPPAPLNDHRPGTGRGGRGRQDSGR